MATCFALLYTEELVNLLCLHQIGDGLFVVPPLTLYYPDGIVNVLKDVEKCDLGLI